MLMGTVSKSLARHVVGLDSAQEAFVHFPTYLLYLSKGYMLR